MALSLLMNLEDAFGQIKMQMKENKYWKGKT